MAMAAKPVPKMDLVSLEQATKMIRHFTPTYALVKELGKGTYGQVFLVEDDLKQVAVKIIPLEFRPTGKDGDEPGVGQDWLRLKNSFNLLNHPSLVRIRDFFRYEESASDVAAYGLIYMDYWPMNLRRCVRKLIEESKHTTARKFALLLNLAELLRRLKADTGLLVTDMKLSNVLVRDGGHGHGVFSLGIADFGGVHREGSSALQRVESTDAYWAPELHEDIQSEIDEKALIYSFGLVAYFVLEGREPYKNTGLDEMAYLKIRKHGGVVTWRAGTGAEAEAGVARLQAIVTRCLAENRQERYADFASLANELCEAQRSWMTRAPVAIPQSVNAWSEPMTGMEFVHLDGGRFFMGQTETEQAYLQKNYSEERFNTWFARELPRHEAALSPFWMARFPVTRGQFAKFVEEALYLTDAEKEGWSFGMKNGIWGEQEGLNWHNPGFDQADSHPVVCVSWFDAVAFVKWLSLRTGLNVGLPSEAQWEYACRAGSDTPFHFGETIGTAQANYDGRVAYGPGKTGEYRARTTPVGSFPANAFGLGDMHGNVWEWCADRLDPAFYGSAEACLKDPLCRQETGVRVRRGGSWSYAPAFLRSAYRGKNYADARYSDIGFRVVIATA